MLDRLRGLLASETPHQGQPHPPGGCPPRCPGRGWQGSSVGPRAQRSRAGPCVSVTDFFHGKFCSGLIPSAIRGPRDTGKYQGEWAKLKIQNFAHPGWGQSHGLVGGVWRREVQALQTGSPRLFTGGCGQGYPVSEAEGAETSIGTGCGCP